MGKKKALILTSIVIIFVVAGLLEFFPVNKASVSGLFLNLLNSELNTQSDENLTSPKVSSSSEEVKTSSSENLASEKKLTESTPAVSSQPSDSPSSGEESSPVTIFSGSIRRGTTLYELLRGEGVSAQEIYQITKSLESFFDPEKCKPGEKIELQTYGENRLIIFKYFPGGLDYYVVRETEPGVFKTKKKNIPVKKVLVGAKGQIDSSLYESMKSEDLSNEIILQFADIFSWEIDFLTDPRRGDTFRVIWERSVNRKREILIEGKILAAQYTNRGKRYTAIFYRNPKGEKGYFTPEGESVRRSFLSSPLNYTRISSHFSYRRFHPILKIYRPHLGIDYAAPTGTPVSTIGDGMVTFAGWNGGFGRYVKIKHPNGYVTSYGHLYRIARGIRKGRRVSQGQVIGYVGSTGLSTGPHLDFRIAKNGRYLNFLKLEFPRASPVKEAYIDDFQQTKDIYAYYLKVLSQYPEDALVFFDKPSREDEVVSSYSFQGSPSRNFPELLPLMQKRLI